MIALGFGADQSLQSLRAHDAAVGHDVFATSDAELTSPHGRLPGTSGRRVGSVRVVGVVDAPTRSSWSGRRDLGLYGLAWSLRSNPGSDR